MADSPYIDSWLNLSTTAAFFCPQGGRFGEVQLSMTVIACEQALCLGEKIASVALFNFLKHNWERGYWKPRQANHAAWPTPTTDHWYYSTKILKKAWQETETRYNNKPELRHYLKKHTEGGWVEQVRQSNGWW